MDEPARTSTLFTIQIAPFWDVVIYGNYAMVELLSANSERICSEMS
jgi:hypothetical protein